MVKFQCDYWWEFGQLPDGYNSERCYADVFQHCAQVFPSGSLAKCPRCRPSTPGWHADNQGKLNDNWCYFLQRGYICQREPKLNPAYYARDGRCVPSDASSALLRL
ncbi:hypothetical protein AAVH_19541 [Aphelenchoides avenae]|nr:hypothetical protein AAVH_19541 [Aphelenchus avenae]